MLSKLYNSTFFKGKEVVGLHIQLLPDGMKYLYCQLKNERNAIEVTRSGNFELLKEFSDLELSKLPLYLSIDGSGIMHFRLKEEFKENPLDQVLPNAKVEDYYIQRVILQGEPWVSFLRRDLLHKIISDLGAATLTPIQLMLGAFELNPSAISELESVSQFDYSLFQNKWKFVNGKLISIEKNDNHLESDTRVINIADDLKLESMYLVPFFNGLIHFGVRGAEISNQPDAINKNKIDFTQKRLFVLGGWAALIFCLILLLVNFLLFDYYNAKLNQVQSELSEKSVNTVKVNELEKEVAEKRVFFEKSGLITPELVAFKADRVAATVPKNILLNQIEINPRLKKKLKADESPSFLFGEIIVSGESKNTIDLNNWVQQLNAFEWIAEVGIIDYETIKNRNIGEFTLKIIVK